ncbi:MAG: aspartate 1-decarboxylase [Chloroflexi bacterium]|nr:aspartate 1-decarboxylase [Chloroflexota bacterium]MDA1220311.1 aspartate 1-decarboxylase [Chloroflexota bacterium]
MRNVLRSKIHRAFITDANADYIGSIIIDRELMEKVDLWDFEKVLICDVTNGNRWETYVLPGERGSGTVSVQGAGAKLCEKGDCVIILSFEVSDVPIEPKMILVDHQNQFLEYIEGAMYEESVH